MDSQMKGNSMHAGYCMCVDAKLEDREIVCSLRTYTNLRTAFAGVDYRIRLNEDVEDNTIIMSPEMYSCMYHDMLEILSVKEDEIETDDSYLGWSDSELTTSDSCV